jgi:hypothetical protein
MTGYSKSARNALDISGMETTITGPPAGAGRIGSILQYPCRLVTALHAVKTRKRIRW